MGILESQSPPEIISARTEDKEETKSEEVRSYPLYWDERDKYSQKEKDLLKRIDAQIFGKSIHVTELGTVITKIAHHQEEEVLFDDFIKNLTIKVNREECAVKYNSEENAFYIVEKEDCLYTPRTLAYKIDINEKSMANYAFGTYDKVTSAIHNLYVKSMANEEKKNMLAKREEEREAIITKINTTHETPTLAEATIYLNYLEEMERTNATIIKGSVKNIVASTILPLFTGVAIGMPGTATTTGEMILGGFLGVCLGASLNDGRLMFIKGVDGVPFPGYTTVKYIKENIEKIKEKAQDNKLIKMKESKLYEIENIDKAVPANSYSVENLDSTLVEKEKIESLNLANSVKKYLDKVTNQIYLLDSVEDKKMFFAEIREIMAEYDERHINIVLQDKNVINLEADSLEKLKRDIFEKIINLEMHIKEVRERDIEINQVLSETKMLEEKIEGFSQFDTLDIEVQKIHDNSARTVKPKQLVKGNKRIN